MHKAELKVSIIIPTKNPGTIFSKVISRVLEQKTNFSFDVLVIDSGSTDGTQDYIRRIVDPRLRLMEIPAGEFGHGKTRNLGISSTSGEYVVLM
jgi:Glycosyltransferases involved in cell wall biogenesis